MSAVEKHPIDLSWNSEQKRFDIGDVVYAVNDADLALNIREYHNFSPEGASRINRATYDALKPGGYYCIIDHTRRHMESTNQENRRRADPVKVILEVQAAGFDLVDSSDLFFKPDDELRYEVGRKTVKGQYRPIRFTVPQARALNSVFLNARVGSKAVMSRADIRSRLVAT
jgi:predicted methyltransferase